jgi:hypothetical protein
MKTNRKWIAAGIAILALPTLFAVVMHREVAGSMTVFTVHGTPLRMYQSDSGNIAFSKRSYATRLNEPQWIIKRNAKAGWALVNIGTLYVEFPFLIADIVNPKN